MTEQLRALIDDAVLFAHCLQTEANVEAARELMDTARKLYVLMTLEQGA